MMRFLLFAACACLYVTPVYATTIQYVGQLAFINNPLGIPDISVGDMYGGQFTYVTVQAMSLLHRNLI